MEAREEPITRSLLAPRGDLPDWAARFERDGRVQIPDVLDVGFSQTLAAHVAQWPQWALITRLGGRQRNFDAGQMDHLDLAKRTRDGIRDAGGVPIEFPVHPIFENCRRPTAALDRNLLYLGLVELLNGYPIDGVVLTTGCDKTTPSQVMAGSAEGSGSRCRRGGSGRRDGCPTVPVPLRIGRSRGGVRP